MSIQTKEMEERIARETVYRHQATAPPTTDPPTETRTTVMHLAGGIVKTTRVTTTKHTMTIAITLVVPLADETHDEERGQNLRPGRGGERIDG